jgi:glutamyl/glutaminyl-tRNA synthetase
LEEVVEIVGDRIKVLPDITQYSEFFFREVPLDKDGEKILRKAAPNLPALKILTEKLEALDPFERGAIEKLVRGQAEEAGVGLGKIIQPVRVAVAGRKIGPGLFESLELLGKEQVVTRLRAAWEAVAGLS